MSSPGQEFISAAGQVQTRIKQLEARLAALELESGHLDAQLVRLKQGAETSTSASMLKLLPFSSKSDAEFFRVLGDKKLNEFKLSDKPVPIVGFYTVSNGKDLDKAWLEVRAGSFETKDIAETMFAHERRAMGTLLNLNTPEQFKVIDKKSFLLEEAQSMLDGIESGAAFERTSSVLARFALLTYADLKKHRYLYWFAFPAFGFLPNDEATVSGIEPLDSACPGLFESLSTSKKLEMDEEFSFFFVDSKNNPRSFREWKEHGPSFVFGFVDPSPSKAFPGWLLRNFILFLTHPKGCGLAGKEVKVVAIRETVTSVPRPASHSFVYTIKLPRQGFDLRTAVGWEHNAQDKMGPRLVDLSEMLDETRLSEAACNLNLSLMKWRAFPDLDDVKLAKTRVLLLGAGTLGCAVARGLMGWGFRSFTFVDSGRVSYSNPVRQSLFVAKDCAGSGKFKAEVAAERCREVHPGVETDFWVGNIPMPGHAGDPKAESDCARLDELVQSHDVICLLTDTRESRWLPTLLGAAHGKIVLNAALGFDSYVVMRHGSTRTQEGARLGCYFCSDIVAPVDSTKDRTLDQQCTVTRPGAAPIAGALLVELLVGLLHHPEGDAARPEDTSSATRLGALPHQIRGYLSSFRNDIITGHAFAQCTACSETVVREYRSRGFAFVKQVLEDPTSLEALTGLDKLKAGHAEAGEDDFVLDEDDFEEEEE